MVGDEDEALEDTDSAAYIAGESKSIEVSIPESSGVFENTHLRGQAR